MTAIHRLRLMEHCRRAGGAGAVGAGLIACALVAGISALLPAKRQLQETRVVVDEARRQVQAPRPVTPVKTVDEQLASFYQHFPDRTQAPHLLEKVYAAGGRIQDTASASGDLLVAQPPDAVFELPFPAAGEDEVRVRIHPGREKQLPVGIDAQIGPRRSFAHRPEGGDTIALDEQESIGDRRQFA